jgi:hypothetical protein
MDRKNLKNNISGSNLLGNLLFITQFGWGAAAVMKNYFM